MKWCNEVVEAPRVLKRNFLVTFLIIGLFGWCIHLRNQLDISNQNLYTSQSKVEQLQLENGKIVSIRDSYIVSNKELKEQLELSNKEIRTLRKQLGEKPKVITKIETVIERDTLKLIEQIDKFSYKDDWMSFSYNPQYQSVMDFSMNVPLNIGMTNDKVFVYSDNPYLNINAVESFRRDEKRWSLGFHFGMGMNYGLIHRQFDIGPTISAGINYRF